MYDMRRALLTLVSTALLSLVLPAPAHAWWEFLEELSGPGPFRGVDVQARLFCRVRPVQINAATKTVTRDVFGNALYDAPVGRLNFERGMIWSVCKPRTPEEVRIFAFDIGASFRWTGEDDRFAGGDRIYMTTIQPAISYNIFNKHPDADYLDFAFGAGWYRFHANNVSVSGGYIEPVRFEFHPTTRFKHRVKWAAAIPVLRVGYVFFPGGFDTAEFGATSPVTIGPDWVLKIGVFFDLEGLKIG
jgi:hypothetical protein